MRTIWTFHTAGQLVFGSGAVNQLGECAEELGAGRVLVITDRSLVEAGVVDRIVTPLSATNRVSCWAGRLKI